MKNAVVWCALVAGFGVVSAPQAYADEPAGKLEGTWFVSAITMNGIKASEAVVKKLSVIVKGNKILVKPGLAVDGMGKIEPGNKDGDEATFTLDPAKLPAQIDLTFGTGKNKMVVKGIYIIENGELKICYSPKARPMDFANIESSGQTLLVARQSQP